MGILDFLKKNNSIDSREANEDSKLNLTDPIIKKMVEWIEHPMEFSKKPDKIEIINKRELFWPTEKKETCYLLRFYVNNIEYIGFTGPITWSFLQIDFNKLSYDELYLRYTGWYIVFATVNSKNYNKQLEGSDKTNLINSLENQGYSNIEVLQNAFLGSQNYYEFKCLKEGVQVKIVGTNDNLTEFKYDHILPFYEFVGVQWGPFDM